MGFQNWAIFLEKSVDYDTREVAFMLKVCQVKCDEMDHEMHQKQTICWTVDTSYVFGLKKASKIP